MSSVGDCLESMGQCLLPPRDEWDEKFDPVVLSTSDKVRHYAVNAFCLAKGVVTLPFAAIYDVSRWLVSKPDKKPKLLQQIPPGDPTPLPEHMGHSDSLFQSSGLGTPASATKGLEGTCQWAGSLNHKRIEGTKEGEDYSKFFFDILGDPDTFVKALRDQGVTAHRFSLEWSVIEPKKGEYNQKAIDLYRAFITKLKENGIEPYVTLHHFVHPQWFEEAGGFADRKMTDYFIGHVGKMMEMFPEVTRWMTFNEPGVFASQSCLRGVYPPHKTGDIAAAGQMQRNLLYAHCQIYKANKKEGRKIGFTHQWLKFEPLEGEGNFVERTVCQSTSEIFYRSIYRFCQTGQYSLAIPGKANVRFSIPNFKLSDYTDFIGIQFYGFPRLKVGLNGGQTYPGYKVVNLTAGPTGFTAGSTCPPGGVMQSFGPSIYPESLKKCLDEAAALKVPLMITEVGCDARVQKFGKKEFEICDETQAQTLQKIVEVLAQSKVKLEALFFWTFIRGHLEWDRGGFPQLGVMHVDKGPDGRLSFRPSPAATYLQKLFEANREIREKREKAS